MFAFDNTRVAFHDKSNWELKKAYWLFRLIGNPWLVKIGAGFTRFALSAKLPISWALKPTVFSHFCGGETIDSCDATIERLGRSKIKTILDYSAEGKERDEDFDYTRDQILATMDKALTNPYIPYAVFKPTGVARFALLEKVQAGESLNEDEKKEWDRVRGRVLKICQRSHDSKIPVMVDAEETWIQNIIDELVEEMIFRFNREKPLIYNTLQMYRHDRLDYLKDLNRRAREKGVFTAVKLVRGAYMEKERERAAEKGYPSPIYSDKQGTDKGYDDAVAYCIENVKDVAVCIGTHNEISCQKGAEKMISLGVPKNHPHISFSQLLGMSDQISYNMAAEDFNVTKYIPYGPVKTVVPYLIRRAEENTSVAGQTSRELLLLGTELERRKKSQ
ncbi:MAG: proline dehydrogenase family protein [Bacteroides sp.]|jgi:proline dehydrogenase|nr:proline dehydrogenase family protein [Bacteroides sp.]